MPMESPSASAGPAGERILRGIGVSPGIAVGRVFLCAPPDDRVTERDIPREGVAREIARFEAALIATRGQIRAIQKDSDPDVAGIVCTRGGSGAARLLPLLDYDAIAANPKPLLGYSDITALHCAIQARTGLVSFHGPIGTGSWNRFVADQFRRVFFERERMHYTNRLDADEDELVPRRNRTVTLRGGRARVLYQCFQTALAGFVFGSPFDVLAQSLFGGFGDRHISN